MYRSTVENESEREWRDSRKSIIGLDYRGMLSGDLYDELRYIEDEQQRCLERMLAAGDSDIYFFEAFVIDQLQREREEIKYELRRRLESKTKPHAVSTRYTREEIDTLKQTPINKIITHLGGETQQRRRYKTHCLLHPDINPSMSVNTESNIWHCFSCGAGGDGLRLVMLVRKCGFWAAINIIKSVI